VLVLVLMVVVAVVVVVAVSCNGTFLLGGDGRGGSHLLEAGGE